MVLAEWAGIAIQNARLYETSERRRGELEKAVRGLEATRDVAVAIGGEIALEHVLELIAKRGRALVSAKSLVILLRDGEELVVHASAGHAREMRGVRLAMSGSISEQVLERRRPERITDIDARLRIDPGEFGVSDPRTALLVPMVYRGDGVGILAAFDHDLESETFAEDDEHTLRTFAASAATAVVLAQSVQSDRLRSSLAAADAERGRWARELHDETLQALAALRLLLRTALQRQDPEGSRQAMREAVGQIEREIANLRAIITELRPPALCELGLCAAIESLIDHTRDHNGLHIDSELALTGAAAEQERDAEDLEASVYRLVQEALTNVAKHAHADRVRVAVSESDCELLVEVQDDGVGYDTDAANDGFGVAGMRERVGLAGGTLKIDSGEHGTLLSASLPKRRRVGRVERSGSERTAS